MYMGRRSWCKSSLGPTRPARCPPSGTYRYRGTRFRVYTFHAEAFPSGPLTDHAC